MHTYIMCGQGLGQVYNQIILNPTVIVNVHTVTSSSNWVPTLEHYSISDKVASVSTFYIR